MVTPPDYSDHVMVVVLLSNRLPASSQAASLSPEGKEREGERKGEGEGEGEGEAGPHAKKARVL